MAVTNGVSKEEFKSSFSELEPLILEEWPELEHGALEGTGGDYEKVVTLVSQETELPRTRVRKHLRELAEMAPAKKSAEKRLHKLISNLEAKTNEISGYVKETMLPSAEEKVRDHLLVSLLVSTCFGFLIGFIFRGLGRGR